MFLKNLTLNVNQDAVEVVHNPEAESTHQVDVNH
jgi:hypothetical protein